MMRKGEQNQNQEADPNLLKDGELLEDREQVKEWMQQMSTPPRKEFVDETYQRLLGEYHKAQKVHRKVKWVRRGLESLAVAAAAFVIFYTIPQWGDGNQAGEGQVQESGMPEEGLGTALGDPTAEENSPHAEEPKADVVLENNAFRVTLPGERLDEENRLRVGRDFQPGDDNLGLRIEGKARVFEAAFLYEVEDGHNILTQGSAMADSGAPEWGNFSIEVILREEPTNPYGMLILYEGSAKDGSPTNQLMIPLAFEMDRGDGQTNQQEDDLAPAKELTYLSEGMEQQVTGQLFYSETLRYYAYIPANFEAHVAPDEWIPQDRPSERSKVTLTAFDLPLEEAVNSKREELRTQERRVQDTVYDDPLPYDGVQLSYADEKNGMLGTVYFLTNGERGIQVEHVYTLEEAEGRVPLVREMVANMLLE